MVDYRINLARTVTSTPEQRRKFYNGMIIYLAVCAAGLVYVAYSASLNVMEAYRENRDRRFLVKTIADVSEFSQGFFRNPQAAYNELQQYSADMALLKASLAERAHFLPVMTQLFSTFPKDVAIESLEASSVQHSIVFGLVGSSKSVKDLQAVWKQNAELNELVDSIKQVTGEVRVVAGEPVYFVKFECILKK